MIAVVPLSVTDICSLLTLWRKLGLKNSAEIKQFLLFLLSLKQNLRKAGLEKLQDAARRLTHRVQVNLCRCAFD